MPWETTENFIRSGHRSPEDFDSDSLRTIDISEEKGIKAIVGCPKGDFADGKCSVGTEVQSFLFDVGKWTVEAAKVWFEEHQKDTVNDVTFRELAAARRAVDDRNVEVAKLIRMVTDVKDGKERFVGAIRGMLPDSCVLAANHNLELSRLTARIREAIAKEGQ